MRASRVLAVVGTRPEVIKVAPVLRALESARDVRVAVVGTAQHRGLMRQMLRTFGLSLDHDLDLMRPDQSPEQVVARMALKFPRVLEAERPRLVLVQGDTVSALGAAVCAFHRGIPIAHIEAGLRSHDPARPFPEELIRAAIDRMSDLLFAPTKGNRANLLAEGIDAGRIHVTGNTIVDAVNSVLGSRGSAMPRDVSAFLRQSRGRPKVLMTVHRRESFGAGLRGIFQGVRRLLKRNPELRIIYPVHPNPHVDLPARKHLRDPRILLARPMDYPAFLRVAGQTSLILSDSGGLQEEAPSLGVPLVVLREVTERPEALSTGRAILAGVRPDSIVRAAERLLRAKRVKTANPFGDGKASQRIVAYIRDFLNAPQKQVTES